MLPTSEHAFVWHKTHSLAEKLVVEMCRTPQEAKELGKTLTLRPDWDLVKVRIMQEIVLTKFLVNKDLQEKLLATGYERLEEINEWHDQFWGKCSCSTHQNNGLNMLGAVLMRTRNMIRDING